MIEAFPDEEAAIDEYSNEYGPSGSMKVLCHAIKPNLLGKALGKR